MVDSFCTSLLIAKCSHRSTMLRFRYLASHKNSLTICNFGALCLCTTHKISSSIDDFLGNGWEVGNSALVKTQRDIKGW